MLMMKHFYTGPLYVNTYLVYDKDTKKAFIVDPGGKSPALDNFIETQKIKPEFIILTHGHCDHIGGVDFYREKFGIPMYAHWKEKELLGSPEYNASQSFFGKPVSMAADKWLNDGDKLDFEGNTLEIIHTPGHSPGGISIHVNNWLFSGDTLFAGSVGRTDFPLCSTADMFDSIRYKLLVLDPETEVFPGHEGFTTIGREIEYNPFL